MGTCPFKAPACFHGANPTPPRCTAHAERGVGARVLRVVTASKESRSCSFPHRRRGGHGRRSCLPGICVRASSWLGVLWLPVRRVGVASSLSVSLFCPLSPRVAENCDACFIQCVFAMLACSNGSLMLLIVFCSHVTCIFVFPCCCCSTSWNSTSCCSVVVMYLLHVFARACAFQRACVSACVRFSVHAFQRARLRLCANDAYTYTRTRAHAHNVGCLIGRGLVIDNLCCV